MSRNRQGIASPAGDRTKKKKKRQELLSVSGTTRDKYRAATQNFLEWSDKMKVPLATEFEFDAGLAQWMNMMYAEGHRAWQGERVVAGLLFFLSEFGKAGNKSIPRSLRCLKGWRELSPSFSRKPLTWPVWCAMAVEMTRFGHSLLSIMVLLSVECYLRSSEALSLTGQSLLPPAASAVPCWVVLLLAQENRQRSKVGTADDTVAIDSGRVNWTQRVFPVLARTNKSPTTSRSSRYSGERPTTLGSKRCLTRCGIQGLRWTSRRDLGTLLPAKNGDLGQQ